MFVQLYQSKYCYCSSFITKNIPSVKNKLLSLFKNCGGRNRLKPGCKAMVPQTRFMQQIIIISILIISFCISKAVWTGDFDKLLLVLSFPFFK